MPHSYAFCLAETTAIYIDFADSTLWLAKAARQVGGDSKVITLEYSEKHAKVARENIASAGFDDIVQVIIGDGRKTITELVENGEKFDLFFIDADKPSELWITLI